MTFIVLMCFSRIRQTALLKENFGYALKDFTGTLRLIPVCDKIDQVLCWADCSFAQPILCLNKRGWFQGHSLLNSALDQLFPVENPTDTYCSTWTDDDAFEPSFWAELENRIYTANRPQVAITSMRRWHHKSTPVDHLTADAAHMRVCSVGLEQVYVRADIMQHYRYGNSPIADGFMVEQLYKECGKGFAFFNDLVVNWNRFV